MSNSDSLTRLIVRFPRNLYDALKTEGERSGVPMAVLIRQLVAAAPFARTEPKDSGRAS